MTDATLALRRERLAFSRRGLALPVALFLGVLAAYGGTVAAILASSPWASLVLVPVCGMLVVMLFVQYQGPSTGGRPIYDSRFNVTARRPLSEERLDV